MNSIISLYKEFIMESFTYKTNGVCSKEINITIENGILTQVSFKSGCNGNLQAIGRLVQGMTVEDVIKKLEGITCNGNGTSCPDQLSKALKEHILGADSSIFRISRLIKSSLFFSTSSIVIDRTSSKQVNSLSIGGILKSRVVNQMLPGFLPHVV